MQMFPKYQGQFWQHESKAENEKMKPLLSAATCIKATMCESAEVMDTYFPCITQSHI